MAVIKFGNIGKGIDLTNLNLFDIFDYDYYSSSSKSLKLYDDSANYALFTGTGLTYKLSGGNIVGVTGGTVTGLKFLKDGVTAFNATGLKVSAAALGKAYFAGDDDAFVKVVQSGSDTVTGSKYADTLTGYDGNDTIYGGAGKDTLIGGKGADDLYGGTGGDTFVFNAISESTVAASGRDTIFDFSRTAGDKIKLNVIDANTKVAGDQAFSFIGTKAFSGKAGELRYVKQASDTYVYADVNGDKKADFAIHFDDPISFKATDFFL